MNFFVRRFWRISLLGVLLCLGQSDSLRASDDSYLCLDANLGEQQLEGMIVCSTAPIISCPSMYIGCPGWSIEPGYAGYATAVAGDPDCPAPIVSYVDEVVVNQSCQYEVHRTWTAEYPGNINPWLFADCTQIIMLTDNTDPLIKNCPIDITVSMNSDCVGIATWSEPVYTDNCGVSTASPNYSSGTVFPEGMTTVIYTVYDNCGNSSTCSFNVTVEGSCCNNAPVIACPTNQNLCPGGGTASYHPDITGYATAIEANNCEDAIITWSDELQTLANCDSGLKVIRTWNAVDPFDSALSSSCVQIIMLTDEENPTVSYCPNDITILTEDPWGAIATWTDPIFNDNCGISTMNYSHTSGSVFGVGTTEVTYSGIDYCGNFLNCSFTVNVIEQVCENNPVITCPPNRSICPGEGPAAYHPDRMGYATAIEGGDYCNEPIIAWADVFLDIPSCPNGMTVKRTWTATDPEDSTLLDSCIQFIEINDATLPTLVSCTTDIIIEANSESGILVNFTIPEFEDNNCGMESIYGTHNSGDFYPIGTTNIIFTGTNECGNSATCSFNITVTPATCNTPPIITCPIDLSICVDADTHPNATGYATAIAGGGINCDTPIVSWSDYVQPTAKCDGAQVITRTWTAQDPNDPTLISTCTQTITTEDELNPVLAGCPDNISVISNGTDCEAIVLWNEPIASDNCEIQQLISSHSPGSWFNEGTTTISYTAYDNCDNSSTCSFTVTVICENLPCSVVPIINCPADYNSCPGSSTNPSVTGYASASPGLGSCDPPILSYSDQLITSGPCAGQKLIHRSWTATDPHDANVYSTCLQIITLSDIIAPTVSSCPNDIVLTGDSNCSAIANWTIPTAYDNCGAVTISSTHNSGSSFSCGTTTVIYTFEDGCGNQSFCSFDVTVLASNIGCSVVPIINCPADWYACPGTSTHPSTTGFGSALPGLSSCDMPITSYSDQVVSNGPCAGATSIHRTWTAFDPNDPTVNSSCVQTIILSDNIPPVVNSCPSNISVMGDSNCHAIASWTAPVATDNCGIANISSTHAPGSIFEEGTTVVTYTISDNCGNITNCTFTVTVSCAPSCVAPIIDCPNYYAGCPGTSTDPSITGYATAIAGSANCAAPILSYSDQILSTGPCPGSQYIYRTWTATDPVDPTLSSSCIQAINISDNIVPTISNVPSDISVYGDENCQAIVTWVAPVATDGCGSPASSSTHNPGSIFDLGTTTVSYTFTDACGNSSTTSFNVTVICLIENCSAAPIISCPLNWNACVGTSILPSTTGYATAIPGGVNCDPPIVTYSDQVVSSGPCVGAQTIYRTWTAKDPNDPTNASSCIQAIILDDSSLPTISNCPDNISVLAGPSCTAVVNWVEPIVTDNCGIASISSNYSSGSVFSTGTTQVIYTITDNCGNAATCSFSVTISCSNQGCSSTPIINCPANYIGCIGASSHPSSTGYATASAGLSSCDAPVVTYSDQIVSSGPCAGAQVIYRTWLATDPNDPTVNASCVQTITIGDTQAPTFVYCPTDITIDGGPWCDAVASWTAVTATDNCGSPSLSSTHTVGELLPLGVTTVTYTATDACGNTAQCSFNVTVTCNNECNQPPMINCPNNVSLCPWSPMTPDVTGYATATGSTNCGTPSVTFNDVIVSSGTCGDKVVYRTWTATEPMNTMLTSSCTQIITLVDNYAPGIWDCPIDITVSNGSPAIWTEPTADDNCELESFTSTHNPGHIFPMGTNTVSYTAVDVCGNISHCSFNVTVISAGGNLNCPDDIVVACGNNGGAYVNWNEPNYTGTCTSSCSIGANIPGFIYMGSFGGSQYYCSVNPATWPQAQAACLANGGYLASVNNQEENNFLANILTNQTAWIGLNDEANEGNFVWTNGDPVTYTNWYEDQPNDYNGNQDFVEMLPDGLWNDQYNYKLLEYIMEIPCSPVTQVSGPNSGSFFTVGTHTITYGLDSSCGNTTCSFTVTVEPSLSIECPENITQVCPEGQSGVHVSWPQPTANSCCTNCTAGGYIPGFIYMGSLNGHYYYCSVNPTTWQNANTSCSLYGGYLASIGSAEENTFLANILTLQSAWIGLNDVNDEGNFTWTSGEPLGYTNWYPQQPNNYGNNQDYCEMLNNGQWNDQYNDSILEYIMEIPGCVNVTQISGPTSGSFFNAGSTTTITYKATDECGNIEYCSFDVTVPDSECNSGGINSDLLHIAGVGFGNLQNNSGNDGGYEDFTNHCANVQAGGSYPISLTPGFGGSKAKCFWKVWVDFNMDGDYTDEGEYIAYGLGSSTISGTITIPWNNIWNGATTMRVACKLNSYPTGPCEVFAYGETEDYCINISGADIQEDGETELRSFDNSEPTVLNSEQLQGLRITVFPNPATDFIRIEHEDISMVESIDIYNMNGKVVIEGIYASKDKINLQGLDNGIYLIRTKYQDGSVSTTRFVIQQ